MDDEEELLIMAGKMFKWLKCEFETAKDGAEAIQKYKNAINTNDPFTIVILDLTVPGGMGGKKQ